MAVTVISVAYFAGKWYRELGTETRKKGYTCNYYILKYNKRLKEKHFQLLILSPLKRTWGINMKTKKSKRTVPILWLLVFGILITGCRGGGKQPKAMAQEGAEVRVRFLKTVEDADCIIISCGERSVIKIGRAHV